jgi:hypothetical protein
VKAAFLLVTAACFTGQVPAVPGGGGDKKPELVKPPITAGPGPVMSTAVPGGCDSCADTGSGHGHFGRFGGGGGFSLFKGRGCDGGCGSCGSTGHARCHHARTTSCDACGGSGGGFFSKFKGRFGGHHGCGCDGGCGTVGCAGGTTGGCAPSFAPPEPVNPPKKMPAPVNPGPPPAKVGFEPQSSPLPTSPAATAPSIEIVAPATPGVPSITTQPRSPF